MTNLPIDVTSTTPAARRRQLTRVLAVAALAAGAVVGIAAPAQAAGISVYHIDGAPSGGSRVVTDPRSAPAGTIVRLPNGTSITIDCGVRLRSGHRSAVWHHITSPVTGYLEDYYTDTPATNRLISGEPTCSSAVIPGKPATTPTTPATPTRTPAKTPSASTPAATRGATINYNEGYAGSCVDYALDRFHQVTGVYPKALGDAKFLATSAAANGWTTSATPRVDSLVVFQPGQNGAGGPTGHAAWVEQISGDRIYIAEMNAPTPFVVTHRWLTPAAGVRYIYAV
jgi:surface antigen